MERILGVDPGLHITGYAVLARSGRVPRLEEAGVVRGGSRNDLPQRLQAIFVGLQSVIDTYQPTAIAIEQVYSHVQRPRTSILMGHARGVICLAAAQRAIPVFDYASTKVKKLLTGNGRAPKSQMQRAIQRELSLSTLPEPADVADALAIALCHFYLDRRSIAV